MVVRNMQIKPAYVQGSLVIQLPTCIGNDLGHLSNLLLGQLPVVVLDSIPNTGEVLCIVSVPSLRRKDYMLELVPARKLMPACQPDSQKKLEAD